MEAHVPVPRPLSAARIARRQRILESTRRLIAQRGYDQVTMQEIAAEASVTKKTLYDIYSSKENLLAQAMAERMTVLLERVAVEVQGPPLERLFAIIGRTIDAVLEVPELSRAVEPVLLLNPGLFGIHEYFDQLHRPCLRQLRATRQIAEWASDDFLLRSMMSDQIAVQNFWANGMIEDHQLKSFATLSVCRMLLPPARGALRDAVLARSRELHAELKDWG